MFIPSKHLLVQGWFGGVKQNYVHCLSIAGLILDQQKISGLTKNFILDSIQECIQSPAQLSPAIWD